MEPVDLSNFQFLKTFLPPLRATTPEVEDERNTPQDRENFDSSQLERRMQALLKQKARKEGLRAAATLVLAVPNILDECVAPTVTMNKLR